MGGSNAGGSAQGGAAGDGELAGAAGEPVSVAGSGALGGGGATAQGGGGNATSGGGAGAGGTAGMSSTGASGSAGAAGTGGCSSVPWFPDGDGDGFGRSSGEVMACAPPSNGAWVKQGGDCNDDNAAVFPMNPDFYGQGYTTSGNTLSFDYDCSGTEEIDPGAKGAAPQCNGLSCSGSGFQATSRSGSGVNDLCGSTKLVTCTGSLLNCSASVTDVDGAPCH